MKRLLHLSVMGLVCLLGAVGASCVEGQPESVPEPVAAPPQENVGEAAAAASSGGATNDCTGKLPVFRPYCHQAGTLVADASCHATVDVFDSVCDPGVAGGTFIPCVVSTPTTGVSGTSVTVGVGANQPVNVTCTDASGSATCHESVTVIDITPPTIHCPTSGTICATTPSGIVVPTPTASDNCGVTVVCSPDPFTMTLAPGSSANISCTATDPSGNSNACSYTVIAPYMPLGIVCPPDQTAVSPAVTFAPATAGGNGTVNVTCNPASGSTFAPGDTTVTCTATDTSAQVASCTFHIRE